MHRAPRNAPEGADHQRGHQHGGTLFARRPRHTPDVSEPPPQRLRRTSCSRTTRERRESRFRRGLRLRGSEGVRRRRCRGGSNPEGSRGPQAGHSSHPQPPLTSLVGVNVVVVVVVDGDGDVNVSAARNLQRHPAEGRACSASRSSTSTVARWTCCPLRDGPRAGSQRVLRTYRPAPPRCPLGPSQHRRGGRSDHGGGCGTALCHRPRIGDGVCRDHRQPEGLAGA